MRLPFAALALFLACAAGADRPRRHFLAVSSTSYNPTAPGPPGEVLLFDRETGAQFARFDFDGRAFVPATTPDGSGAYVVVTGDHAGVAVIDLASATLRSSIAIPGMQGQFAIADDRLLAATSSGITALDLDATRVIRSVPCPGWPRLLVYNGVNGHAYASMIGRQDLCVVTPDLDAAPPLPLPIGLHDMVDNILMLDHNILLVTTYSGGVGPYRTAALDVAGERSQMLPALDGAYPLSVARDDPGVLYVLSDGGTTAYRIAFDAAGFPVFTNDGQAPAGFRDDRYIYTGISGSCSTLEGPVMCTAGFRMIDPATGAEVRSFLFAGRDAFLTLSAVRPFASSVSPPRRSRR